MNVMLNILSVFFSLFRIVRVAFIAVLLNISYGGAMAETDLDFQACCHNKAEANQIFPGGHFWHCGSRWWGSYGEKIRLKKKAERKRKGETKLIAVAKA